MRTLIQLFLGLAVLPHFSFAQTPADATDESVASAPAQDNAVNSTEVNTYFRSSRKNPKADYQVTYRESNGQVEGFMFTNTGPNSVIPIPNRGIGMGPDRNFEMSFPDRARQDIKFTFTDRPTEKLSELMESYFYFFPRKVLPTIQWPNDGTSVFKVTLTTGEEVLFSTVTKEMVGGVLKETSPIDLGPDRFKRKFGKVEYSGTGVYIRVDKRGADPRLGTTAVITQGKKTCKVPSSKLFDQDENSAVLFKFPTDAGFNEFLKTTCKMSF